MKLAELFRAANGSPIEWHGETVCMIYEVPSLTSDQLVRVVFRKASSERPQALRLKARNGKLSVNGQLLDDVVLWSDTSPNTVDLVATPAEGEMSCRVWNAWRDKMGVMQAWIGNAGMIVKKSAEGGLVLTCSDGFGEPTFDALVVELQFIWQASAEN